MLKTEELVLIFDIVPSVLHGVLRHIVSVCMHSICAFSFVGITGVD
jgi:hypothetical protein